ncbi:hypothetical protein JKP88DRAFT_265692 [Tribonema minus]|uniref:Uncharacterized protein n=1 Tax=Tribonema minus TaxID=303371 RepID=A0A835YI92_9STRA|nr:hypothetical protein JKP88DRAFT_265692 [Tribonema minus]
MGRSGKEGAAKAKALYRSGDEQFWSQALAAYPAAVASANDQVARYITSCMSGITDERPSFSELDEWYSKDLLPAIKTRDPPSLTKVELMKLLAWKLARCTWRTESLVNNVKSNSEALVKQLSEAAFANKDDILKANKTLDKGPNGKSGLRGVGPALASGIMSVVDETGATPFMSDEALYGAGLEPLKYTTKQYEALMHSMHDTARELGEGWTARKVEMALWSAGMLGCPKAAKGGGGGGQPEKVGGGGGGEAEGEEKRGFKRGGEEGGGRMSEPSKRVKGEGKA